MKRFFFRLGRLLLGKDRAVEIRDQEEWFRAAASPAEATVTRTGYDQVAEPAAGGAGIAADRGIDEESS
jgi:hypothetical protein